MYAATGLVAVLGLWLAAGSLPQDLGRGPRSSAPTAARPPAAPLHTVARPSPAPATMAAKSSAAPAPAAGPRRGVTLPPAGGRADYQLGGGYPPATGVQIVTRDRTDRPRPGSYNICYVNAFQTQPEQNGWWRAHARTLLLHDGQGREVTDPAWPGEVLLDTRTPATRGALTRIIGAWIDGCAHSGDLAVEPDNLDSWTRSRGLLRQGDNVAFARRLTARAHADALAIAQKNTAELGGQGPAIGFDFAVVEECQVYDECDAYTSVYGRRVIEVEYSDSGRAAFDTACRVRRGRASIVYRDRQLTRPGDPDHVYAAC